MSSSIARVIEEAIGVQPQTDDSPQPQPVAETEMSDLTGDASPAESAMNGTPSRFVIDLDGVVNRAGKSTVTPPAGGPVEPIRHGRACERERAAYFGCALLS